MAIPRWTPRTETTKREDKLLKRVSKTRKLFGFLRTYRSQLFNEAYQEELASMYRDTGEGREPVAPALLAMATLLQAYANVSDAEAVDLSVVDARWQMVLGVLDADEPPFSQAALHAFRERLIAHDMDRRLLERTVELAKETGAFDFKKLPINGTGSLGYGQPNVPGSGSWAYNIMPFIELDNVFKSTLGVTAYDMTATHLHDKKLVAFLCPTRSRVGYKPDNATNNAGSMTDYVINPRINWPNDSPIENLNENNRPDQNRTLAFIVDGTSNTILLGEKALQTGQYRDMFVNNFDETLWKGGAGGTARGRSAFPFNTGQPSPAIVNDSPTVTHGNRWGSPHIGSCLFVLADGSVRGIKYGVDPLPAMLPLDGSTNPIPD